MAGKSDMDRFSVLPLELQERIFNLLPIRDITVGRQLCTTTRQVIDSAIALRYKLELAAAGMVDNPECTSLSFAEKYRLLRRFTEAKNTFCQSHYSEMKFEVMPLGPLHLLWNTSILFAVDSMKIMRLPSTILGTAAVESTYSPSQLPPGSRMVCVNPADDLSVMIRNEEEGLSFISFPLRRDVSTPWQHNLRSYSHAGLYISYKMFAGLFSWKCVWKNARIDAIQL
ncbi:hypothetical protein C8Q75DRAFT_584091 [Abortiporus biennis]|nr:hypothetical protein C8Q75DRAFT_584091 [Abortiporus biennis]